MEAREESMGRNGVGFDKRWLHGFPLVFCLCLMAFVPGTAFAREAAHKSAYDRCLETGGAANGEYPAMMDCISAEIGRRDAVLNALYQALRRRLPPERMH